MRAEGRELEVMKMSSLVVPAEAQRVQQFFLREDLRGLFPPMVVALVKGAWSKFVTFDELMIELLFAKLLSEAPELADQFGPAVELAPVELLRLIDRSVRSLDPRTEGILKEGYREAPAAAGARCQSRLDSARFFASYDLTRAQWEKVRSAFLWAFARIPHLDDMEREDLAGDRASALARFFDEAILEPMVGQAEFEAAQLSDAVVEGMERSAQEMLDRCQEAGTFFYARIFEEHPSALQHFRTSDMDTQAHHLIAAVVFLARAARQPGSMRAELRNLAAVHVNYNIPTAAYPLVAAPLMETIEVFGGPLSDAERQGWGILLDRVIRIVSDPMYLQERLVAAAGEFFEQVAEELQWPQRKRDKRWSEILTEIRATGTYTHSFEELEHGARLAWRNAPKCIGRISWRNLVVRDRRAVTEPQAIFEECAKHLREASNGGNIDIVLTVFAPRRSGERWGPRIWNGQLVRFAGYGQPDGSVIGDRANVALTDAIRRLGWTPPMPQGDFDVLPLVVDVPSHGPQVFEFEEKDILRVPITHPGSPAFDALGLQWCAVPAISNFRLEIGGINYGCVPFNGWFMGTEIARDLFEEKRYNRAEAIAAAFGLDTSTDLSLWRDRAFLELNVAVIASFQKARVTLVDHHTASRQFMTHEMREKRAGRECPAQWSWIVPPTGGSTTQVWHHDMRDFHLRPAFGYAADRWMVEEGSLDPVERRAVHQADRPLVLFASETGTAEAYARMVGRLLSGLSPKVMSMDEAAGADLSGESFVLLVTSTHRDGEIPTNGQALHRALAGLAPGSLAGVRFAVLGIGNRIYSNFCAAATAFDSALAAAGATRAVALTLADEIARQADTVKAWIEVVSHLLGTEVRRSDPAHRPRIEVVAPGTEAEATRPTNATVVFNGELLSAAGPGRSTREIILRIDAGDGRAEAHRPGDHLAVMPVNPPEEVARVRRHLGLEADSWLRIRDDQGDAGFGAAYPVDRLLGSDLDLAFPEAPEELLSALRDSARDPADREVLDKWIGLLDLASADAARIAHKKWLRDHFKTLGDLLDNFPGSCPPLDVLMEIVPRLRPRLFSIASSPLADPDCLRIIVGSHHYPGAAGELRQGVASRHLCSLAPGDRLHAVVKPAHRQLPPDFDGPLLLIGAGTGLSALYGVIEERAARGLRGPDHPAHLFFGCRSDAEFIMRDRLLAWREEGVLSSVTAAFSRQTAAKAYVQDALDLAGPEVFDLLGDPATHVMVCGDARMAAEVADRILQILQRLGGVSYTEAMQRLRGLREGGRYLEDVWGLQLNRDLVLGEVVQDRYNQGNGWVRRLGRKLGATRRGNPAIVRYPA